MGIVELVRLDPLWVTSACRVQLLPMGIFFSALAVGPIWDSATTASSAALSSRYIHNIPSKADIDFDQSPPAARAISALELTK
jgi:hypothetical protein